MKAKLYRVRITKIADNRYVALKEEFVNNASKKKAVSSVLSENEGYQLYSVDIMY